MAKEKEILRLRSLGMSQKAIMSVVHCASRKIKSTYEKADELSITYELIKDKTDDEIEEIFGNKKEVIYYHERPDYDYVHKELLKPGVTVMLLWEEYVERCKLENKPFLKYTQFSKLYKKHVEKNNLTMHIGQKPGEKVEVDFAGQTLPIYDLSRRQIISKAYLFVAVLPFSQYIYCEATDNMKQESWINLHINMLRFFGGIPIKIVCDNLKTGVIKHPKEGEIVLNEAYESLAQHYMVAIMPAQVRKPKQKPSVEGTVGKIASAIIAKLRNIRFISLSHVEEEIFKALKEFNDAPFQKREGSRTEVFMNCEKEMLRELPAIPYEVCTWLYDHKVSLDFHVSFKTNKYSVPYQYVGKKVDIKVNSNSLEIFYEHSRIAIHPKLPDYMKYKYSTIEDHMPDAFQKVEWDDERIKRWANKIGPSTFVVINKIFDSVKIKEQGYNSCLAVLKLANKFSNDRLENACELALTKVKCPRYHHLNGILMNNQDLIWMSNKDSNKKIDDGGYVRGADYYGGKYND